jgi:hypothetical protein
MTDGALHAAALFAPCRLFIFVAADALLITMAPAAPQLTLTGQPIWHQQRYPS